ncbi:unnamed protein product [Urochloa decumbens]|uniref:Uncharacterized protein n=1 Tax=Urochloa decumbens TaxID=240449 RepID=A0ABC9EIP5_9POAL
MALRASAAAMALFLLLSLMAVAHCAVVPLEEAAGGLATKASSSAADGEEGLLRLPSREDSAVPDDVDTVEKEAVEPVAEPDPDRSNPESDHYGGVEELTAEKLSIEGQEDEEKTEEQIHDDEHDQEEKKGKKHHGGDGKGKKKEKTTKKHHQSDGEEDDEKTKKQVHRHRHRVEKEKTKKRPCHHKNRSNDDGDSDDEDDEHEKKEKRRWRKKAVGRSIFGHGRRSQREEAAKEEVKN